MGTNSNIGLASVLTVYGNPVDFEKLINSHGQLCKIKKAITCPCVGPNFGSPNIYCNICHGNGYTYTYQRRFRVADEKSPVVGNKIYPYWTPILSVSKVQTVASEIQGGIVDFTVSSFTPDEITVNAEIDPIKNRRVTYAFDGWTHVLEDQLEVDATNKIMYAPGTLYNAKYQSSNPYGAFSDITKIVKLWNKITGVEITNYDFNGRIITTPSAIVADQMYAEYYTSDLTRVINTELDIKNDNEKFTHAIQSGMSKMAFYPYWELSKGDVVIMTGNVLYKNEVLTHVKDIDQLWELEIFQLNNVILDEDGNKYYIDTDYILQGRHIKWIGNKPAVNKKISVRYGYKPAFVIFDNNTALNTLENKAYPQICLVQNYSRATKNDLIKLIVN